METDVVSTFTDQQVNPNKRFKPGQVYTVEDLDHTSESTYVAPPSLSDFARERVSLQDVIKVAHCTNLPFLVRYLSEAGRMLPMRVSRFDQEA